MKEFFLVALGGGLGSGLRFLIGKHLNPLIQNFYLGTFVVNMLGCLAIGILFGYALKTNHAYPMQTALLAIGFCGGFTTFSTFGLEQFLLLKDGNYLSFLTYTLSSLAVGIAAVSLGFWLSRLG